MAKNTEDNKDKNKLSQTSKSYESYFGKKIICVWCLPRDSKPVVRVESDCGYIDIARLFEITCNTLNLHPISRRFFALFHGITFPTKKYDSDEVIYLPCRAPVSIQKWSFDLTVEIKAIKTDAIAYRLLAMQFMLDVEFSRIVLSTEEQNILQEILDPEFVCYKQYVDVARGMEGYSSFTFQNVSVVNKVKIVNTTFDKDCVIKIICNKKKIVVVSDSVMVGIPWRKIRRFVDVVETKSINLEIFIADERAFVWLEVQCNQGTLLLQVITEYINLMKLVIEKSEFRQPTWATSNSRQHALSWSGLKTELFGFKAKSSPVINNFDTFTESYSDDEEDNDPLTNPIQNFQSHCDDDSRQNVEAPTTCNAEQLNHMPPCFESANCGENICVNKECGQLDGVVQINDL